MFTGIVEEVGEVVSLERTGGGCRLVVKASKVLEGLSIGGSLAVNGCCLTATSVEGSTASFDLAAETLLRTKFDQRLRAGSRVNLERALLATARLEGHVVQGHVDGVARLDAIEEAGDSREITFVLPSDLERYCVEKGSIALDGVSLTCASVDSSLVRVAVIPHTLECTTFGRLRAGDLVSVEVDVFAKYIANYLEKRLPH